MYSTVILKEALDILALGGKNEGLRILIKFSKPKLLNTK
jgi:hypothetical protein